MQNMTKNQRGDDMMSEVGNGMGDIFAQLTNSILLLIIAICVLLGVGAYFVYRSRRATKEEKQEDSEEVEERDEQ